jgi:hypothetical protein
MCYSYEQSRNNLLISLITCIILYNYKNNKNYKIFALIFGYVGIMQLFDMIFWSTQNIKDPYNAKLNYITTKIAMLVNHSQPLVFAYIIYSFIGKLGILTLLILTIYSFVMLIYTYFAYHKINYTLVSNKYIKSHNYTVTPSRYGLHWTWNYQPYYKEVYTIYLLTLIILSYENLSNPYNIILALIFLLSFLFSSFYFKTQSVGRWWCKIAAFTPIFIIMLNFLKII